MANTFLAVFGWNQKIVQTYAMTKLV